MDADEPKVKAIVAEKEEALRRVEALGGIVSRPPSALTDAAVKDFAERVDVFRRYVHGFRAIGQACILTKYLTETDAPSAYRDEARALLHQRLEGLQQLRSEEPTSELPSLMRTSYAVVCVK